jgi:hypothetical protein
MDGNLWGRSYSIVMAADHPNPRRGCRFSDRVIVLVLLRAAADNLSINRACRPEAWVGLPGMSDLPSQPTVSRRSRTAGVRTLLEAVEGRLRAAGAADERLVAVDGRALPINAHSKDPDAKWGYAARGFAYGYKLHAIWGTGAVPNAWEIRPLNEAESVIAATRLVPRLPPTRHRRYLVGDAAFDSNRLYAAAAERGYQLLAPPRHRGQGLGHRPHHPARLRGRDLLRTRYGRRLYRQRGLIERQFGNAVMRPEGLGQLPGHVRRLPRVRLFVHCKLILNGTRILMNRNAFTPLAA